MQDTTAAEQKKGALQTGPQLCLVGDPSPDGGIQLAKRLAPSGCLSVGRDESPNSATWSLLMTLSTSGLSSDPPLKV